MLNLNKVGRPLARIDGGKYSGHVVSVSDQFLNSKQKEPVDNLIQEFRQLKIANDSKFLHIPDTTKEREILYITGPSGSGKRTYTRKEEAQEQAHLIVLQLSLRRVPGQGWSKAYNAQRDHAHGPHQGERAQ